MSCPDSGYISFWGSLSNEYGANTPGITWIKPTIKENGKVPVFNYANNQLMWKTYNAGSLSYTTADYKKYYILGITEDSYNGRDIGETKYKTTLIAHNKKSGRSPIFKGVHRTLFLSYLILKPRKLVEWNDHLNLTLDVIIGNIRILPITRVE